MFEALKKYMKKLDKKFTWDNLEPYLNNKLSRAAIFVPIVGYLILFNDVLIEGFRHQVLTSGVDSTYFLDEKTRLKLIYFGLVITGVSTIFYRLLRPKVLKQGNMLDKYIEYGFRNFSIKEITLYYLMFEKSLDDDNFDSSSPKDQWKSFLEDAKWSDGWGVINKNKSQVDRDEKINFSLAKDRHQDLIIQILEHHYFQATSKNRVLLLIFFMLTTAAYTLLFLPSLDLFLRVSQLALAPS